MQPLKSTRLQYTVGLFWATAELVIKHKRHATRCHAHTYTVRGVPLLHFSHSQAVGQAANANTR